MKHLFIAAFLLVTGAASAQKRSNVTIDAAGNYVTTKAVKDTAAATGRYYVDKAGTLWPVFRSPKGSLFALRTSKNGKVYRYYLKPDADTLNWEGN